MIQLTLLNTRFNGCISSLLSYVTLVNIPILSPTAQPAQRYRHHLKYWKEKYHQGINSELKRKMLGKKD